MPNTLDLPRIAGLRDIADDYAAILSDVWGVVHNGVRAHKSAVEALGHFRRTRGPVVMITNAPRPWRDVQRLLREFAIPDDTYDSIVTSGDLTATMLRAHEGDKVYHLGPDRDLPMLEGIAIERVGPEAADFVLCTGLFDDERESMDAYVELLGKLRGRSLSMICANPDLVVERGNRLVYCAGSIAQLYEQMGGAVIYAGKPHGPVYQRAIEEIAGYAGRPLNPGDVLAIGDSIRTDLAGAAHAGIPSLFIAGGIHSEEHPDGRGLADAFAKANVSPRAVMEQLVW